MWDSWSSKCVLFTTTSVNLSPLSSFICLFIFLFFSIASSDLPNRNMSPMWRYNCSDKSGNLCVLSLWWPIDLIQMGMDEAACRAAAAWPHPHLFSLRSHNNLGGWRESGWPLYRFCEVRHCFCLHFLHFWPADPCKPKVWKVQSQITGLCRLKADSSRWMSGVSLCTPHLQTAESPF